MSKTIDQRVVEMRFDNKQFESATATTMSTIEKLKQKLNFTGATKGLENISDAAKKVNLSGLGSAVETVQAKFSALQVVGVTALANITNSAINAGKKIVSALTIDPIRTGFQEYETQMNAIQTILANTSHAGTTLDDVTAALDELNKYADQTIYNFTEMTKNIGTFTAAGVDLDTSVGAIKGIANLAAISGSTSYQASTAMYQLSQALAAGRVSLQDWNSVVNAGMGGKVFQDALVNTAEAMGIVVDKSVSFRESISAAGGKESWLTADVLLNTLNQFTGDLTDAELAAMGFTQEQIKNIQSMAVTANDAATKVKTLTQLWDTMKEAVQSGWAQSWKLIIGDFEEAKARLTDLSNYFGEFIQKSADSRNDLLAGALNPQWDQLIEQINEAGVATEDFNKELEKTLKTHGRSVDYFIKKYGSLGEAFKQGALSSDMIVETLKRMAGVSSEASKATEDMTGKLEYFQKVVNDVWMGDYKNGEERVKALTAAGYDYAQVQDLVNKTVDGHKLTLEDLTDVQLKSVGYTDDEVKALRELAKQAEETGTPLNQLIENLSKPSGRELLWESLFNILDSVAKVLGAVGEAWRDAFPPMTSQQLYNIIEAFHDFTENLVPADDTIKNLTRTLKGLFAILDIVTTILGGGLKAAFSVLDTILGAFDMNLLEFTAILGDSAVALRDFIFDNDLVAKGIKVVADGIVSAATAIKGWVQAFMDLPEVQAAIQKLVDRLVSLKDVGLDAIAGLKDGLLDGVKSIPEVLIRIGTLILDTIKGVLGIQSPSTEMYKVGENTVQGFANGFLDNVAKVLNAIKEFGQKIISTITDLLGGIDWSTVIGAGISIGLLLLSKKLIGIVGAIVSPLEGLGDILSGVGEVIEEAAKPIAKTISGLANVLNSFAFNLKAEAIKSIAIALGILAASLFVLSKIDGKSLLKAIGALAALAVVIGVLSAAVGKFGPDSALKFSGFALALVGISSSLLIVSGALKVIDSLKPETAGQTIAIFTTIMISLMGLVAIFGQFVKGKASANIAKVGSMMIGLSVALLLMTGVMKLISGMTAGELVKGGAAILAFVGIVSLLSLVTQLIGPGIEKLGSTMIKLSIALGLMVIVVKLISGMNAGELIKGGVAISAFVVIIGTLAVITNLASPVANKLGSTMLAMSASMLILAAVAKIMATMSVGDMMKGFAAITAFSLIIGLLVFITNFVNKDLPKISLMLLSMSASIAILAGVSILLSLIDIPGLAKGIVAVGLLSGIMSFLMIMTKDAQDIHGNLVAMSVAIGILAVSVAVLSFIDPVKLTGAVLAMSILMGMFAILIESSSNVKSSTATLVTMTVAIGLIGIMVYALSTLPVESVLSTAASLSLLLLSMTASIKILNNIGSVSAKAIGSLALIELALVGLGGIIKWLSDVDPTSSIANATALSILLGSMTGITFILAAVGKIGAGAAIQGALALDGVIVVIGGLMAGIGALVEYFPSLEGFLNKGIVLLEQIGYGLGSFLGNIVGGLLAGVTSGLPEIGTNLSDFMTNIQTFIEGANSVKPETVDAVKSLAEMILILTAADFINGIMNFFSGGQSTNLADFGETLIPFGESMAEFSDRVSGIDDKSVTAAANAGKALSEMVKNLPSEGGWFQKIFGEQSLESFSEQLVGFGEAIVDFSDTVDGKISDTGVISAANAGKAISELSNSLPKTSGFLQDFLGEQDLGTFSDQLLAFGSAIVEFSETVDGKVNESAVTAAASAGMAMAELNNNLPKQGGVLQNFLGNQDLGVFGEQLKVFGQAIADFSDVVIDVDPAVVESAANAGSTLSALANSLPKQDGWLQSIFGEQDMAVFGQQLISFGSNFASYSSYMNDVDPDVVNNTVNAAKSVVELANNLPENKLFSNDTDLDEFGEQLAGFGSYFSTYYGYISSIDTTKLSSVITEVGKLIDTAGRMSSVDTKSMKNFGKALGDLGKSGVDDFVNAFANSNSKVTTAVQTLITYFINGVNSKTTELNTTFTTLLNAIVTTITSKYQEFNKAGQTLMTKFVDGMSSKESAAKNLVSNMISSVASTLKNGYSDFYNAGTNLVRGFIDGMEDHMDDVRRAARELAREAYREAMDELDEHSPSRKFFQIGEYVAVGFANGISDNERIAGKSARSMANTALTTVKETLSKLSDEISNDVDVQPTIRPVLDLTDVTAKSAQLNSLFSRNQAMAISSSMASRSTYTPEQTTSTRPETGATFQFTQNNYSPKALSRVEIYRQTKNQFSAMERMMTT